MIPMRTCELIFYDYSPEILRFQNNELIQIRAAAKQLLSTMGSNLSDLRAVTLPLIVI